MKLVKLSDALFRVVSENNTFEGPWNKVYVHMLYELDMLPEEVEFALEAMKAKGEDTANFGIHGFFTHTSNTPQVGQVMLELKTVKELRSEFNTLWNKNPDSIETRQAYNRLMKFYHGLDVELAMQVISASETLNVA